MKRSRSLQGISKMKLGAAAVLCVCFVVSANAFTAIPSHPSVLKRTGNAVCAPPLAFARSQIGRPTLALRAADDDTKGGPLGDESDMVPRDSVDPSYFVIGGILGESEKICPALAPRHHVFCASPPYLLPPAQLFVALAGCVPLAYLMIQACVISIGFVPDQCRIGLGQ
jgi:hypothetical protein